MAKPPSNTPEPATKAPPAKTRAAKAPTTKPKAAKPDAPTIKPAKTPRPATAKLPVAKAAANPPVLTAAPQDLGATKAKGKAKESRADAKSVFEEASSKISRLAADILADRIVPTYEQIKALAALALGQKPPRSPKPKGKKKKK